MEEEQQMRLEELGFRARQIKVNMFDRLDDTQSAAAPHIYWGGEDLPRKEFLLQV
jgi:hypothetical protein